MTGLGLGLELVGLRLARVPLAACWALGGCGLATAAGRADAETCDADVLADSVLEARLRLVTKLKPGDPSDASDTCDAAADSPGRGRGRGRSSTTSDSGWPGRSAFLPLPPLLCSSTRRTVYSTSPDGWDRLPPPTLTPAAVSSRKNVIVLFRLRSSP